MLVEYQDSAEQAGQIARYAIPLAAKYQLPLNPLVYTVVYQHIAKINKNLSDAFERLEEEGKVTKENVEQIYQNHISFDDIEALEALKDALQGLMKNTRKGVRQASSDSKEYEDCLDGAVRELNVNSQNDSIKSIVNSLLDHTQKMRSNTLKLSQELEQANIKIDEMQSKFKKVKHESLTDPLTGLKNRRAFDVMFQRMCDNAKASSEPLSLLILDLDFFKKINDTHGHVMGDAVLKWLGKLINDSVRGSDVPARIGGEEFAILLPGTGVDGASSVAENIRKNVSARSLKHSKLVLGQITVSIGVSRYDESKSMGNYSAK